MANGRIFRMLSLVAAVCFVQGTPPRCDTSLLMEYFNLKNYEYYMNMGYADSCISIMMKITPDFRAEDMVAAAQSLHELHNGQSSGKTAVHEPEVMKLLRTEGIRCSFNNMHPVLIGWDLNVTIFINFDNAINQLKIILTETLKDQPTHFRYFYRDQVGDPAIEPIHDVFTAIDMGRGLLHFVYQNSNNSMHTGHDVLQIKNIDNGIRITKIRSEKISVKFSQLNMDPSGNYAFYTAPGRAGRDAVYQMKVDYPKFTLGAQDAQKQTAIFTINRHDQIFPMDRNAVLVWKFAGKKRTAWLYEGSYTAGKQDNGFASFSPIGCILSGVSDHTGRLLLKIHQIRRQQ